MKILKFLFILLLIPQICFGAASRDFDGVNDYIDTASTLGDIDSGPITYCGWMNPENAGESGLGYVVARIGTQQVSFNFQNSATRISLLVSRSTSNMSRRTADFSFGAWQSFCTTWDGGLTDETTSIHIYRNGSEVTYDGGGTGSGTHNSADGEFEIGNRVSDTARSYNGALNYISVFNRVLSDYEIKEIYWKPEIIASGIQTHIPIWGDSPEQDISGNNRDGTVSGATSINDGAPVMFGGGLPL